MEGKFKFEHKSTRSEEQIDFQGDYFPEDVTLEELKERMKKVARKE